MQVPGNMGRLTTVLELVFITSFFSAHTDLKASKPFSRCMDRVRRVKEGMDRVRRVKEGMTSKYLYYNKIFLQGIVPCLQHKSRTADLSRSV